MYIGYSCMHACLVHATKLAAMHKALTDRITQRAQ